MNLKWRVERKEKRLRPASRRSVS